MPKTITLDDKTALQRFGQTSYKGIMNGVSHIIPIVLIGGILLSVIDIIGMEIIGWDLRGTQEYITAVPMREFFYVMRQISLTVLGLMLPVLGAYVAEGIGGKSALAPGFVGGTLAKGGLFGFANIASSGFLGAIFAGIIAGYAVTWIRKWKFMKKYESLNNLFVSPILSSCLVILPMILVIGPFIAMLTAEFTMGLQWLTDHNMTLLVGFIIGAMACFDFGGPINKIAYLFCVGLWADGFMIFYSAFTVAKIIPGISVGIGALCFPKYFTQEEKDEAIPSLVLSGLGGIGEQVIPFALREPMKVIPAQMIGGAVAAGLVMFSGIEIGVGAGGSLVTALMTSNPLLWLLYFGIGLFLATAIMIFLKSKNKK